MWPHLPCNDPLGGIRRGVRCVLDTSAMFSFSGLGKFSSSFTCVIIIYLHSMIGKHSCHLNRIGNPFGVLVRRSSILVFQDMIFSSGSSYLM